MHLENLVKAICSCGVSFSVWEKQNADGKGSGLHNFTSLMGPAKKILLEKLPPKLHGILSSEASDTIIKIWKVQYIYILFLLLLMTIELECYHKTS